MLKFQYFSLNTEGEATLNIPDLKKNYSVFNQNAKLPAQHFTLIGTDFGNKIKVIPDSKLPQYFGKLLTFVEHPLNQDTLGLLDDQNEQNLVKIAPQLLDMLEITYRILD